MDINNIDLETLQQAVRIQTEIEELEEQLRNVLSGTTSSKKRRTSKKKSAKKTRKKRKMSPEAIERIREGQRKRWAKKKKATKKN